MANEHLHQQLLRAQSAAVAAAAATKAAAAAQASAAAQAQAQLPQAEDSRAVSSAAPYRLVPLVQGGVAQPSPPVLVAHPSDVSQLCQQLDEEERCRTLAASDALLMLCCTPDGPMAAGGGEPRLQQLGGPAAAVSKGPAA